MGAAGNERKYWTGIVKAGIPFAIVNLAVICIVYLLLAELGHLTLLSSDAAEMRAGVDTQGLTHTYSLLSWGILLALAVCPVILLAISMLAGIVSAVANDVRDEKEAKTNGRSIGLIMWAVVMATAMAYFSGIIVSMVSNIPPAANIVILAIVFVVLAIPVVLILWVFVCFSTIGSRIFLRANAGVDSTISDLPSIVRKSMAKGERAWVKTAIGALVVMWTVLMFYSMIFVFENLH